MDHLTLAALIAITAVGITAGVLWLTTGRDTYGTILLAAGATIVGTLAAPYLLGWFL